MDLINFDAQHIWHPYESINNQTSYLVKKAQGVYLTLDNGQKLIDSMSSWWCVIHGYSHPELVIAGQKQLADCSHVMFGGLTHSPAILLAKLLLSLLPPKLSKIFFADSGSVAVEVAIKMALQYHNDNPKKKRFMTIKGGYHGDTFGAMSVCDPINGMHHYFSSFLPQAIFLPRPKTAWQQALLEEDKKTLKIFMQRYGEETAFFILEPILQGAGGMYMYSAEYLNLLKDYCVEYDILLIFDEIATGFGRTGRLFAFHHTDCVPDIICLGKALTGGMLTLSSTITSEHVAKKIEQGNNILMHGPTFMANPLACQIAYASTQLLLKYDWQKKIKQIETILKKHLSNLNSLPHIKEVRILGAVGVIEFYQSIDIKAVQDFFVEKNVWIRPFNHLMYIMPPYIITDEQLEHITQTMCQYCYQTI